MMLRRIGGAGGIAYTVLVAIENLDVLKTPALGAPPLEIARHYTAEHDALAVMAIAGGLALSAYVVFAVGVFGMVRGDRGGRAEPWAVLGLAGGIAGPALAAAGQAAHATLLVRAHAGLSADSATAFLYDIHLEVQTVAALFIALFLAGMAAAGRRSGAMPGPFVWSGWVLALYVILLSPAAYATGAGAQRTVLVGFALTALWELALGGWMVLTTGTAPTEPLPVLARRAMFGLVAIAAGVSGVALVAFPGSTPTFFSWGLSPSPLASLIGAFYIASAVTFALAVSRNWRETRGLTVGIVGLSVPIFVVSLVHHDIFDFGVPQAWAWVLLFGAFPIAAIVLMVTQPHAVGQGRPADMPTWARAVLAIIAGALIAAAAALWIDPIGMTRHVPFVVPPLGGRVLGGWMAFLAVLAVWSAARARWEEIKLPVLALLLLPLGGLAAVARSANDLESTHRGAYVVAFALVAAGATAVALASRAEPQSP